MNPENPLKEGGNLEGYLVSETDSKRIKESAANDNKSEAEAREEIERDLEKIRQVIQEVNDATREDRDLEERVKALWVEIDHLAQAIRSWSIDHELAEQYETLNGELHEAVRHYTQRINLEEL